jgi:hypothetical protein
MDSLLLMPFSGQPFAASNAHDTGYWSFTDNGEYIQTGGATDGTIVGNHHGRTAPIQIDGKHCALLNEQGGQLIQSQAAAIPAKNEYIVEKTSG